jgi:hypothetical protein
MARMGLPGSLLVALALAPAAAPAQAIGAPSDVAATHAYIQANYAVARAGVAAIRPAQAKIENLNANLSLQCPGVGDGSPENEASQPVSHEVAVALWSISYGTAAGPIQKFARTVRRLHWSNPTITRMAHTNAVKLGELATIPLPPLCQDVRSWKASGFQIIPTAVVNLVERVEAIEPKPVSARLLAPYERGADANILARTERLEMNVEEAEFTVGQRDWIQVLETLGLQE